MFRTVGKRTTMRSESRMASPIDSPVAASPANRTVQLRVDVPLLIVISILLVFGLLMVYSASYDPSLEAYDNPLFVFRRQLVFMLIGVLIAGGVVFMDYHFWKRLAVPAMAVTILMLLAVLIIGESRQGAVRTLSGGSGQPSELAKLVTVVYLAVWLYSKRENLNNVSFGLIPMAVMLGLLGGLIYVQPDLSAVVTIFFLGGLMFFLAGGDLKQIAIMIVVALLAGWIVVQISATGSERISSYLAGLEDPTQASYHVRRSIEAFANGRWLGVGIGQGETKLTGLPVPHTDSIFAVVGEELGTLGAIALIILYVLLLWRGLTIARRSPDELGALLAAGLTIWLAIEAFINMAVIVNLLPFAGNALPFISSGGSNLIISLVAIGILLNISRKGVQSKEDSGRLFGAVVNLRWRDRRRRVSRPRRSESANKS
jgi:cell division protein FtsW